MFNYCPRCKSDKIEFDGFKKYACGSCNWTYFLNSCTAVMAILTYDNQVLFVRRSKEPSIGKLDFPGGFVDPGETAEEAVARELMEELNITNLEFKYLGTAANKYDYKDVTYSTCDLVFHAELEIVPTDYQESEISEIILLDKNEINDKDIAFPSMKKGIEYFLKETKSITKY